MELFITIAPQKSPFSGIVNKYTYMYIVIKITLKMKIVDEHKKNLELRLFVLNVCHIYTLHICTLNSK